MTISATALTALAAASDQVDRIAERVSRAGLDLESPTGDVVDLSEEMVRLLAAKTAFQVAIKLAQTGDEMAEHTLDLLG
jgi:flagellar hook protein FlgE